MAYPYQTIALNGRRVSLKKIVEGKVEASTPFEASTLSFIKSWLSGQQQFRLKTSGSTGISRKIIATRNQMIGSARLTIQTVGLKKKSKILLCIDPQYIGGIMMLVRAFVNNMQIHAIEPTAVKNFNLFPTRIEFAAFVPLQIHALVRLRGSRLQFNKVKNIIIGGAALNRQDEIFLQKCKSSIYITYGMTETLSHVALKKISPEAEEWFTTLSGVHIYKDKRDCLVIKAPFLTKKIYTNDIVELISPSTFIWLGRYDHIINTGGVKVIPETVEKSVPKVLSKLKIANRYYIKGEPDRRLGEKVVLVLEGKKIVKAKERLLLAVLKEELPLYHAPKKIIYVSRFREVNSKIKRQ